MFGVESSPYRIHSLVSSLGLVLSLLNLQELPYPILRLHWSLLYW